MCARESFRDQLETVQAGRVQACASVIVFGGRRIVGAEAS